MTVQNIEKLTLANNNFRKVISTTKYQQIVLMSLLPSEDIGEEVHENITQFFRIEEGAGVAIINGKKSKLKANSFLVVPAGTRHNIVNSSKTDKLKFYTIYSSVHAPHAPDCVQKKKTDIEC
jgi:mannose-6-phosphate isomerase-like protein (cupin superfamily)